jgi:diapolycopene oxygenase
MNGQKVHIIGSGVAGLACAARLAHAGFTAAVWEAADGPGGKLREMWLGPYRFDRGPSLFTLPEALDRVFEDCGKNPRNYYRYRKLENLTHYFFDNGKRFVAHAEPGVLAERASEATGEASESIMAYLQKSEWMYRHAGEVFLENSLHHPRQLLNRKTLRLLGALHRLPMLDRMASYNSKHLHTAEMQQYFNRFATYNGSDPYQAPALLNLIPHLEHGKGAYLPEGGMYSITKALYKLCCDLGVEFHFNAPVESIAHQNGKVTGIVSGGRFMSSKWVVSNMDVLPTYRKLLKDLKPPEKLLNQEKSSSAIIFYWGVKGTFPELGLHNIFFSSDYKKEFQQIFREQVIPEDPTIYLNITSKYEAEDAPHGSENWFVMVNTPPNRGQDWNRWIQDTRERVLRRLEKEFKTPIAERIEQEDVMDPREIERRTSSFGGSLYGNASNNRWAAFLRHRNDVQKPRGLFVCGGSVHPGGGVPLCLHSARIAAGLLMKSTHYMKGH